MLLGRKPSYISEGFARGLNGQNSVPLNLFRAIKHKQKYPPLEHSYNIQTGNTIGIKLSKLRIIENMAGNYCKFAFNTVHNYNIWHSVALHY